MLMLKYSQKDRRFLLILLTVVLALGVFFRCYNLDRKIYWHDEVYTSIRTAGYNGAEIIEATFNGDKISVDDLLKYQRLNNNKTWADSWQKLVDHPEHPPLYYLLSRAWQQLFGSSITATRSLSVLFSFLLFPAVFWLCWELFERSTPGWWTMGLLAISPVQVLYAQEAREYSLLLLTTALSCTALVGAVKRNRLLWWLFYALSTTANLYVSLLGGYIAIAQVVYILLLQKFRPNKTTISCGVASVFSLVLFSPWLGNIYRQWNVLEAKTSWADMTRPFVELLRMWELHLNSTFIDFYPSVSGYISVRIIGFVFIFVLLCYGFLYRRTEPRSWLFLACVALVPTLMLVLPDVIDGGIKSVMTRYFLPSLLMVQIAVAYWLSFWQRQDFKRNLVIGLIAVCGVVSCGMSAHSYHWWNKVVGAHNVQIAAIINSYSQPVVIANTIVNNGNHDVNVGDFISLNHLLTKEAELILFKNEEIPILKKSFQSSSIQKSTILLWNISEEIRAKFALQNNCELLPIEGEYYPPLWLVKSIAAD